MTEEKKRSSKKEIGSIASQYATFGGKRQEGEQPNRSDSQTAERNDAPEERSRDAQTVGHLSAQISSRSGASEAKLSESLPAKSPGILEEKSQDAQPSNSSAIQTASRSGAQASRHPTIQEENMQTVEPSNRPATNRRKRTVYIDADLDKWVRHRIADTEEELSEVMNLALRLLREQTPPDPQEL